MDVELAKPVHALEFFEPVERNLTRTADELQELSSFFLVERPDGTPEPLDLRRRCGVVVVLRVVPPVIHVDFGQARDQQLQLLLTEDRDEFRWDDVVET